ncbi:hypothetical protein R3I94_006326 [Phoxinus phoxinus]
MSMLANPLCFCDPKESGVFRASETQRCFLPDEWKSMQHYGWRCKFLLLYFDVVVDSLKNTGLCDVH